jgi:alpha-galactosidase
VRLRPIRLRSLSHERGGPEREALVDARSSGTAALGPLAVTWSGDERAIAWRVANRGDRPLAVRSVALVYAVEATAPIRMFRHGYQSWSPTGVATLGVDVDPSTIADLELLQAAHHADQRRAQEGELRSELVTVLADASGPSTVLLGFDGGVEHDGTFRLRPTDSGGAELHVEAFLGDAVFAPGEERTLHGVAIDAGDAPASDKLAAWATRVGAANGARTKAPFLVGWCSWYQYFTEITEGTLRSNLALAADWPFDLFQLDDGYQASIGDWLHTNDTFPSDLDQIADAIRAAGRTPGIWLAPFLAAADSTVGAEHPDWLARYQLDGQDHGALRAWWNPAWSDADAGFQRGLDTTNPEVLAHLEATAAALVDAGYDYLKLDFTFSPSAAGGYDDPTRTPAQRVRAGFDAIRRGAGDDTFLLGCGVPLGPVIGVVDGVRIGQDVAPRWSLPGGDETVPGYADVEPAVRHAYGNTVARAFLHRRLWLNDPDCLMLRTTATDLSPAAVRTWADTIAMSGGMVLVSDDLALLDGSARSLLDETIALGRQVDTEAVGGRTPDAPDLLDRTPPSRLQAAGRMLVVDPDDGTSTLSGR